MFVALYILAARFHLFEAFVRAVRPSGPSDLDEVLVAFALLPVVFVALVAVRWRELRRALVRNLISERALEGSAHRYQELFDNATSGISRWNFDGTLVIANPAFIAMVGAAESSSGFALGDLMDAALLADLMEHVRSGASVGPVEMQWCADSRVIDVRLTAALPHEQELDVFDLLTQDVTSERGLETQLRHAQKMDAVGRLAGGIAHDFNNLLTVILNEAELAREEVGGSSAAQASLTGVIRAGERAAVLTRQLLTFSRRGVVNPTVFAVGDVVNDMVRMLRRLIGEEVELRVRVDAEPALVRADCSQIEQVILNLVVNARDAMPTGGSLVIESELRVLDQHYADAHIGVIAGEYAMVAVSDSGLGMTAEVQERLFEPFFTTKLLGQGTGLGLATSFGIVKQAGGHIGVYSEAGLGTTMRIYLPRFRGAATAPVPQPSLPPMRGCDETILIVEDEPAVRTVATRVLERQGYHVLTAANGVDALRVMEAHPCPVDLVVSDMVMPDIGGRDLAEQIESGHPGVKMLFMSGYTDDIVRKHRMLRDDLPFLQKPFTVAAFANAVDLVLHGQAHPIPA